MAQSRQKRSEEKRIISPAFSQFVQHRIMEIIGVFLLFFAAILAISLLTYNASDPSGNFAVDVEAKNWLGNVGAYISDALLQWFGYASFLIIFALVFYGIRYLRALGSSAYFRFRPLLLIPSIIGLSAILSWITPDNPRSDPFVANNYGGVLGDFVAHLFGKRLEVFGSPITFFIFVVMCIITFILIHFALMTPFHFWKKAWMRVSHRMRLVLDRKKENIKEEISDKLENRPSIVFSQAEDDRIEKSKKENLGSQFFNKIMMFKSLFSQDKRKTNQNLDPADDKKEATSYPEDGKVASASQDMPESQSDWEDSADLPIHTESLVNNEREYKSESSIKNSAAFPHGAAAPSVSDGKKSAKEISLPMFRKDTAAEEQLTSSPSQDMLKNTAEHTPKIMAAPKIPSSGSNYLYPTLAMLDEAPAKADQDPKQIKQLEENAERLEQTLREFGVKGQIVSVRPGPVVTLYELEPAPGTRTSRVVGLADDIARQMLAASVRVAAVPGKNVIGIEMPNEKRETVWLRTLFDHESFREAKGKLAIALGEDIGGEPMMVDLAKMPHLLIAGTTGSGKSVAVNTMILSLLYRLKPEECRLIMIDPKMLELSVYEGIPHLLTPVVTDPMKAVVSLKWAVREMDERYRKMAKMGVRNIAGYNTRLKEAIAKGETLTKDIQTGFDENGSPITESVPLDMEVMPYIVIIIDEVADLMMMGGRQDIEIAVQRLAQKARAAGLHVIMATQRPSVDVITGTIKANFPTRISFAVTSRIDSRTILGEQGAEQLLGMGDMLYMAGGGKIDRAHGPFVSDEEVEEIANHIRAQGTPQYVTAVTEDVDDDGKPIGSGENGGASSEKDELYDQALAIVLRENKASTSFIQRQLSIGYNRAARIIEQMEADGVISPADRVGRRTVLIEDHTQGEL